MADETVIERIEGTAFTAGANQPFLLDEPEIVYWVERGFLDVFAVELFDEEKASRVPYVTRVPAGSMCFGAQRLAGPDGGAGLFSFLAVPSMDASLVRGARAKVASRENFDLTAAVWIDEWVSRLSEFVTYGRPPPRDVRLLDADPDVPYPAGSDVSAHHLDVIWVTTDQTTRFVGDEELAIPGGSRPVPLTERTWLALESDAEVSARHTPGVIVSGELWPSLDRFSAIALECAALFWSRKAQQQEEHHRRLHQLRVTSTAKMFGSLGRVLAGVPVHEAAASDARTPLQSAASVVAEAAGVPLEIPRNFKESAHPKEAVETLVRASGIRSRGITLSSGWWRRDGPSFVAVTREGDRPVAMLSDGRGAYRGVDPADGAAFDVKEKDAAKIRREGMMLHMPLPAAVRGGLAALRHVLRGRSRDVGVLLAMAVLSGLTALLTPVLTGDLLAEVIPRVDTPMWIAYLAALLLAAIGAAMFDIVLALALLRIEGRVDEQLQAAVWLRLLTLPAPFFRGFTAGDLADRANGVTMIRQVLTGATASAVIGGVFSIFSFALLFYYSWQLALFAGLLVLVLIGATWVFARGAMSHHRAAFTIQGLIDGFVFQLITGLSKLRMANAETDALGRWAEHYAGQKRETLAARRWMAGQFAFNSMFAPLCSLVLFALIWYMLIAGEQQAGFGLAEFLSFNAAFGQFAAAMTGLTAAWTTVVSIIPLFERVQPILEAEPETAGVGSDPGDLSGGIEFSNVSFRYLPTVPNAVDRVSFQIRPGDFVAFVGPSGSGKSTIYRLLLGFERPDLGAILLDGHDLSSLDMAAVRSRMGVVLQNSQLSADSIFKNISCNAPMTMDEAWEAARAVGLAEDVEAMPMGMHTVLPEGGGGLSGGQKQRLLIARAVARKPRILLLDEATSALDNRTQAIVQESMRRLSITRVVIAHRLTTVQDADRIFVMEAGRIVETGSHDELMARDGAFAALARRQIA